MRSRRSIAAFTLIELLVVIAILGLLATLVAPSLVHFRKGDALAAGTRQMLDAMARARQLAISQRTTVYVAFVPPTFWNTNGYSIPAQELVRVTNVFDKQLRGYAFISLRSVGDQPGQATARYLSTWQSLPEGTFIPRLEIRLEPGPDRSRRPRSSDPPSLSGNWVSLHKKPPVPVRAHGFDPFGHFVRRAALCCVQLSRPIVHR